MTRTKIRWGVLLWACLVLPFGFYLWDIRATVKPANASRQRILSEVAKQAFIPKITIVCDLKGIIVGVSGDTKEIGYRADELLGQPVTILMEYGALASHMKAFAQRASQEPNRTEVRVYDVRVITKDKDSKEVTLVIKDLISKEGRQFISWMLFPN